mgnify:CR=1 FL=1
MVSEKLNELRKKKGLTNQQIADTCNLPLSTVTKVMSGETKDPTLTTLKAIADALGVTLDYLFIEEVESDASKQMSAETFNIMLREKNHEIAKAHSEKRALFYLVIALIAVLVGMILLDALNGRVGWIRYGETAREMIKGATQFFLGT